MINYSKTRSGYQSVFILTLLFGIWVAGCTDSNSPPSPSATQAAPAEFTGGERLFNNNCAGCHGIGAQGTDRGPTFLSKIYEPSHHGDAAFRLAAQNGVRAHHWNFGDMPKIDGVEGEEIGQIISYIRWLQRENGIS